MRPSNAPQDGFSGEQLLERARTMAPGFAERAAHAEELRCLPKQSVEEIVAAGIPAALVPRKFGGHQLDFTTWLDVSVEVGRACTATAWCTSLMMHYGLLVAMFPEQAQQDVWRNGPNTLLAGALFQRSGSVTPVSSGYRVSGEFSYGSGVAYADWLIVCGALRNDDENGDGAATGGRPDLRLLLIPPGHFSFQDDWFTVGMRGTGSSTVVVEDTFVPAEYTIALEDKLRGTVPGGEIHGGMYRLPWASYSGLTFVGPLLGAARGALDHFARWVGNKRSPFGEPVAERPHVLVGLAEVDAQLDAAELLLRRIIAEGDRHHDAPLPEALQHRMARDWCYSARLITNAVEQLYRLGGTSVQAESNPIQRVWRDVHTGASHVSLEFNTHSVNHGRSLMGLPPAAGAFG